ncbi:MAG TPA: coagulation factor 5/8 type domain-containing protein [Terriglobales bacterium]|nr:coagulation factor 5/8 type domain-containing protein [Terriglobales bacterium]
MSVRTFASRRLALVAAALALVALAVLAPATATATTTIRATPSAEQPDFGPNVFVFNPGMPQSQIQATVDAVAAEQVGNQFGTQRFALLFEPGTYGSAASPLIFQVGYYTTVAGLGASPTDVTVNGAIDVFNQCDSGGCTALVNFWRSLSNLTINVTLPKTAPAYAPAPPGRESAGCLNTAEFWATSQASPVRRVNVNGFVTLFDYCGSPNFSSGGFIADSVFSNSTVLNGSQQQFIVRNTSLDGWTNGVWNQVFMGDTGKVPPQSFGSIAQEAGGPPPFTTLATSPGATREEPFLTVDASGGFSVFVPALQNHSSGPTWTNGTTAGESIPIDDFFIARPSDSAQEINSQLARGENLILSPGVYHLDRALEVRRPDTVVLGLGFPTLVPDDGDAAMEVADVAGVKLSGVLFDAGPVNSPALLQVGTGHHGGAHASDADDPTMIQDVFFRVGGVGPAKVSTGLVINSGEVLVDDIWAWRADHGTAVGWTSNTSDTGVLVNGDDVTMYGLFVEHFQKFNVLWNGENGRTVFFQNELPYDPPDQATYSHDGILGWAAYKVADTVQAHEGWALGAYCFFHVNPTIHASRAFEAPVTPGVKFHDLLTVSLGGVGVIDHVINDTGAAAQGSATVPVNLVSFP